MSSKNKKYKADKSRWYINDPARKVLAEIMSSERVSVEISRDIRSAEALGWEPYFVVHFSYDDSSEMYATGTDKYNISNAIINAEKKLTKVKKEHDMTERLANYPVPGKYFNNTYFFDCKCESPYHIMRWSMDYDDDVNWPPELYADFMMKPKSGFLKRFLHALKYLFKIPPMYDSFECFALQRKDIPAFRKMLDSFERVFSSSKYCRARAKAGKTRKK